MGDVAQVATGRLRDSSMASPAASPAGAQAVPAQAIPVRSGTKDELPNIRDLAVTPGGLHFLGTTPGGTRIIYDKNTLLHYRQSPLSKTPPPGFPSIPGVTAPGEQVVDEEGDGGRAKWKTHRHKVRLPRKNRSQKTRKYSRWSDFCIN